MFYIECCGLIQNGIFNLKVNICLFRKNANNKV